VNGITNPARSGDFVSIRSIRIEASSLTKAPIALLVIVNEGDWDEVRLDAHELLETGFVANLTQELREHLERCRARLEGRDRPEATRCPACECGYAQWPVLRVREVGA
jgi:hypothetical protein